MKKISILLSLLLVVALCLGLCACGTPGNNNQNEEKTYRFIYDLQGGTIAEEALNFTWKDVIGGNNNVCFHDIRFLGKARSDAGLFCLEPVNPRRFFSQKIKAKKWDIHQDFCHTSSYR